MEQVVKLTGRIAEVMPLQKGISSRTGNEWKSQEYLFEYFPWSGASYPSRIVVRIFGEEDIAKFNLKQYEQDVTLTLRFAAQKSQDGTRWYNEIRITNVERPTAVHQDGGEAAVAQQQTEQPQKPAAAPFPPQVDQNGNPTNGEKKDDDLPF